MQHYELFASPRIPFFRVYTIVRTIVSVLCQFCATVQSILYCAIRHQFVSCTHFFSRICRAFRCFYANFLSFHSMKSCDTVLLCTVLCATISEALCFCVYVYREFWSCAHSHILCTNAMECNLVCSFAESCRGANIVVSTQSSAIECGAVNEAGCFEATFRIVDVQNISIVCAYKDADATCRFSKYFVQNSTFHLDCINPTTGLTSS